MCVLMTTSGEYCFIESCNLIFAGFAAGRPHVHMSLDLRILYNT